MPRDLFNEVVAAMQAADWKIAIDRQQDRIFAIVGAAVGDLLVRLHVNQDKEVLIVRVRVERACPKPLRDQMAVWCNQKNWALKFGFFICDRKDGELVFRDSVDVEDVKVTSQFIDNFVRRAPAAVLRNYEEIQQILSQRDH
jgi:hypothetical protein